MALRKQFIINRKLQLSIVLYFFCIGLAVAVGTYLLLTRAFQGYIDELATGVAGFNKNGLGIALTDLRANLVRDVVTASIAGLVGTLIGGILVSHRIAGPLHQLESAMKAYVDTHEPKEVHFRKHDFAKSIGDLYNSIIKKR